MNAALPADAPLLARRPRRIAVFRALHLGDLLCTVPALRALRGAAPQAEITLIGLPWTQPFTARYRHYLDHWLEYPLGEELPDDPRHEPRLRDFLGAVRARRFDLAIQLHGSGERSNGLVAAFGAARVAGFRPAGAPSADGAAFLPWRDDEGEIERWLRLLRHLGARGDDVIDLPVQALERCESSLLLAQAGLAGRRYVCIHAGARLPSRRWPLARFRAVAARLAAAGYSLALTGSAAEIAQNNELRNGLRLPPGIALGDFAGRTSVGALAEIVARAALLVANDTGISHVAAAVGTPSIIISSGGDAKRWAPLRRDLHQVLAEAPPCRPCLHVECPYPGHPCATAIDVEAVLAAARQLLDRGVRHVA
ncbi:glycosyltransferase family 9 protein [Solimonas soli]|uniref:glycosyltransferase family 9 protein n=1 Tax=Solimonas soli TaxID=413479 RepID=UPI0004B749F0|nr:glycosyltransferase family 9 protein [Solimonas soli]